MWDFPPSTVVFPCISLYLLRRGFDCLFVYRYDFTHSQIIKTVETYKLLIYLLNEVMHCGIEGISTIRIVEFIGFDQFDEVF